MKLEKSEIILYLITFVLAACSLVYELLIAQTLSSFVDNTVVWYSLILGVFLAAMGAGALFSEKVTDDKNGWLRLFKLELALSIVGSTAVGTIHCAHVLFGYMWKKVLFWPAVQQYGFQILAVGTFFLICITITVIIGFLTGLEIPLIIQLAKKTIKRRNVTNRILAFDYFGALVAGVGFPLWLVPTYNLFTINFMTALCNLSVGGVISFVYLRKARSSENSLKVACVYVLLLAAAIININTIEQYFLKKYYFYLSQGNLKEFISPLRDFPPIERINSAYSKIDLVYAPSYRDPYTPIFYESYSTKLREFPQSPRRYKLFLNGDVQFNSDFEELYHEYFAHVSIMLNDKIPRDILILGAGDGLLLRELVKYPQIEHIDLVEIDPIMIKLGKTHPVLTFLNQQSFFDTRVKITINDGYSFLKANRKKYDAIYMDFPDPHDYNLSKLYSFEFYHFIKRSLSDDGFAVFDATGIRRFITYEGHDDVLISPDNPWPEYFNTLAAAGFETIVPYISNLEIDNKPAKINLSNYIDDDLVIVERSNEVVGGMIQSNYKRILAKESKDFLASKIVENYTKGLQEGFIFIKEKKGPLNHEYRDHGIKLHILNEKRFKLAFEFPGKLTRITDSDKINSIMRPTLPASSFISWIKLPNE